jgi:DNA-binding NarL/FixJ family response regulator/AraC-like DNA-binding protein
MRGTDGYSLLPDHMAEDFALIHAHARRMSAQIEGYKGGNAAKERGSRRMKCLLVEDERQIREGMVSLVQWRELGFDEVLTASNGMEALEILDNVAPDIIISDVRMPRMNGVQLIKAVRERGCATPFLFISGFSDKEYLMAAIRYKASDYIEKPVMISELTERVRAIMADSADTGNWITARSVLEPGARRPESFAHADRYYVGILLLSRDGMSLTRAQIEGRLREYMGAALYEEESPERSLVVAAAGPMAADFGGFVDALNHAGGGYALCMSRALSDADMLAEAYREADACSSLSYMGPLRGLYEYSPADAALAEYISEWSKELASLMARKLYPMLPKYMAARLREIGGMQLMRTDAVNAMAALAATMELDMQHVESKMDFAQASQALLAGADSWVQQRLDSEMSPATARALRYMVDNLSRAISVSELARQAFVSASHLSYLCRSDTGVSIKQYLSDMRMETAKLLLGQGMPPHEVAAQIGIQDAMYFSRLFKRTFGVAPSDFT